MALALSKSEFLENLKVIIPPEPLKDAANSIEIKVRMNETEILRRFDLADTIEDIKNLIKYRTEMDYTIGYILYTPKSY